MEYGSHVYYVSRLGRVEDAGGGNIRLVLLERKGSLEEAVLDLIMPSAALDEFARIIAGTHANAPAEFHWSTLADGTTDWLCPSFQAYFNLSVRDAGEWGWLVIIHPEDAANMHAQWEKAVRTGDPYKAKARFRCYDDRYRWTVNRAVPVRDSSGKIVKWNGTTKVEAQLVASGGSGVQ